MTDNELLLAISNMLDPIREEVKEIREDVRGIREDVRGIGERVKKVELTQENIVIPRLQNIEACYTATYDRYKTSVEDYEQIKEDVFLLKQVVMEHSEKLQKIS